MLASIVSSYSQRNNSFAVDDYLYQMIVYNRFNELKVPFSVMTTAASFDHCSGFLGGINTEIKERIELQIRNSDILIVAIDRGLTDELISQLNIAKEKNMTIIFFTLYNSQNSPYYKIVDRLNKEKHDTVEDKLNSFYSVMEMLERNSRMRYDVSGDLTDYRLNFTLEISKVKCFSQDLITKSMNR